MKIALLTITWRRPALLGRLIECFNRQTHPDREMIVLDDGGDYPDQPQGDRWRIVSVNRRFRSLGSKRNACAAMASPDAEGFLIMDDDDFLFPWGIAATSRALENAPWAQPRAAFEWDQEGNLIRQETFGRRRPRYIDYHSGWSYRRKTFEEARGYPLVGEEDTYLRDQLVEAHGPGTDTICQEFPEPFVIYGTPEMVYRISYLYNAFRGQEMHAKTWFTAATMPPQGIFAVGWDKDYLAIPRPQASRIRPW